MTDGKEIFVKIKAVNNGIATDFCKCVIFCGGEFDDI